jgi:RNA chaperone Hfq
MDASLLDIILDDLLAGATKACFVLRNRTRVIGRVRAFDSYVILVEDQRTSIVYRHALSSVAPAVVTGVAQAAPRHAESAKPAPRPAAPTRQKKKERPVPRSVAAEPSLNTSMKEGLLRWMREHNDK